MFVDFDFSPYAYQFKKNNDPLEPATLETVFGMLGSCGESPASATDSIRELRNRGSITRIAIGRDTKVTFFAKRVPAAS